MTRADLLALAARVEAATGPDRALDAKIAQAVGATPEGEALGIGLAASIVAVCVLGLVASIAQLVEVLSR